MIGDDIEVRVTSVVGERARIDVAFRSASANRCAWACRFPGLADACKPEPHIGDDVEVSVLSVIGEKLRIGIQAPRSVPYTAVRCTSRSSANRLACSLRPSRARGAPPLL